VVSPLFIEKVPYIFHFRPCVLGFHFLKLERQQQVPVREEAVLAEIDGEKRRRNVNICEYDGDRRH